MLAEIYGWFTEGFDTADLKDAKALVDELDDKLWCRARSATARTQPIFRGKPSVRPLLQVGRESATAAESLICGICRSLIF
jgi:hypothetical protein